MTGTEKQWKEFGGKVSICRQNKNMTQDVLAGKLGVTPQALSKWERGVSLPDISMLADLAGILEVSVDWLLGIGQSGVGDKGDDEEQQYIGKCLRNALPPLDLIFGTGLTKLFVESDKYMELIPALRRNFAGQGLLVPVVRIMDDGKLGENEFMVRSYFKVLHNETIENPDENTMKYMIERLGNCVWKKYAEIINPDMMKSLVDNLKVAYPALIEGVVPERISYGFLTDIARKTMRHEANISIVYLPKMIEIADCCLRENSTATAQSIADEIAEELCTPDNYWSIIWKRNAGEEQKKS